MPTKAQYERFRNRVMKCSRCGRAIKTNNYAKIGNYFYGPTCARKMSLTNKQKKVKTMDYETDDKQARLF